MGNGNGTRSGEPSRNGRERLEMESWQFKWKGKDVGGWMAFWEEHAEMGESGARMKIWNAMNFALPMTQEWEERRRLLLLRVSGGVESRSNIICMCLYIVSRCTCSAFCWSRVLFCSIIDLCLNWIVANLLNKNIRRTMSRYWHVEEEVQTRGKLPGNRNLYIYVVAFNVSMILLLLQK